MKKGLIRTFVLVLFANITQAGLYSENWDISPANHHNWGCWIETNGINMSWSSTGGWNNSGCVSVPVESTKEWMDGWSAFWPAYTERDSRERSQDISLNGSILNIHASMANPATLNGGTLHFFIGEWDTGGQSYAFYILNTAVTINTGSWDALTSINIGGASDWSIVGSSNWT